MKKIPHTLALLLLANAANAQIQSATLTISGVVPPSPCTVSLAGGGLVDFQDMKKSDVQQNQLQNNVAYIINSRAVGLSVNCNSDISIALDLTDNKATSKAPIDSADAYYFGIGTHLGSNIGAYSLGISQLLIASALSALVKPGSYFTRPVGVLAPGAWVKAPANSNSTKFFQPRYSLGFDRNGFLGSPQALKTITGPIIVQPYLLKSVIDASTSQVRLDGSATITLQYF